MHQYGWLGERAPGLCADSHSSGDSEIIEDVLSEKD